jgi:hypothetical protein
LGYASAVARGNDGRIPESAAVDASSENNRSRFQRM